MSSDLSDSTSSISGSTSTGKTSLETSNSLEGTIAAFLQDAANVCSVPPKIKLPNRGTMKIPPFKAKSTSSPQTPKSSLSKTRNLQRSLKTVRFLAHEISELPPDKNIKASLNKSLAVATVMRKISPKKRMNTGITVNTLSEKNTNNSVKANTESKPSPSSKTTSTNSPFNETALAGNLPCEPCFNLSWPDVHWLLQNYNFSAAYDSRRKTGSFVSNVHATLGEFMRIFELTPRPVCQSQSELIREELEIAEESGHFVRGPPSSQLFVVPSNSFTRWSIEEKYEEEEKPVPKEVCRAFQRRMKTPVLPNSLYKKPPIPEPDPPLTYSERMQLKALETYMSWYGHLHEKRDLPPPEKKERPVEPEPEPIAPPKGKKGKKGKGEKVKPPTPPPFDFTAWRKEAMPVASTRLFRVWFSPPLYEQRTPQYSPPPTPPGDLPEPLSEFALFLKMIHGRPDFNPHSTRESTENS